MKYNWKLKCNFYFSLIEIFDHCSTISLSLFVKTSITNRAFKHVFRLCDHLKMLYVPFTRLGPHGLDYLGLSNTNRMSKIFICNTFIYLGCTALQLSHPFLYKDTSHKFDRVRFSMSKHHANHYVIACSLPPLLCLLLSVTVHCLVGEIQLPILQKLSKIAAVSKLCEALRWSLRR